MTGLYRAIAVGIVAIATGLLLAGCPNTDTTTGTTCDQAGAIKTEIKAQTHHTTQWKCEYVNRGDEKRWVKISG